MVQVELALRLLTRMRSDGVRPGAPHYTSLGAVVERRVKLSGAYANTHNIIQ